MQTRMHDEFGVGCQVKVRVPKRGLTRMKTCWGATHLLNPRLCESGVLTVRSKVTRAMCAFLMQCYGENVTYIFLLGSRLHACLHAG
jgi:hypothetical protein